MIGFIRLIFIILIYTSFLSGCGMFHKKNSQYKSGIEERPLEVPPDLDTPKTSDTFEVLKGK